jgi:hypothetical protein
MAKAEARFDAGDAVRPNASFYFADATSIGLFLDVMGDDTYWSGHKDNMHWLDSADSPNWRTRNFSVGVDRAEGAVGFIPLPQKTPSGIPRGGGSDVPAAPAP